MHLCETDSAMRLGLNLDHHCISRCQDLGCLVDNDVTMHVANSILVSGRLLGVTCIIDPLLQYLN